MPFIWHCKAFFSAPHHVLLRVTIVLPRSLHKSSCSFAVVAESGARVKVRTHLPTFSNMCSDVVLP